jgi:hypothetical protein
MGKSKSAAVALMLMGALPLLTSKAHAALNDYDGFDYTGTALNGQSGGSGWNGGWFTTSTTDNTLSDDSTSLTYPASFESIGGNGGTAGAHVKTGGLVANASTSRKLSNTVPLNVDGTVFYASALVRKNTANGGGVNTDNILLEFVDSGANRRWGFGIEGTGDKPWLNANGSSSAATAVTPGDTYFLVTKIVSSATGTDQAFLKVYGTNYDSTISFTEPTTWDVSLTETTGAILDRIRIRIDSANTASLPGEVDEIRIGTDWVSVLPEPAGVAMAGIGAIGLLSRRRRIPQR